jgi:rhodanese-related sulfurtransferase
MEEITAAELHELLGEDGADAGEAVHVVDIRGPQSFARGHIPGSENVPFAELPDRIERLEGAGRVVTVCPIGESSVQAARLIESYEGVDGEVASLADGIEGWEYGLETGRDGGTGNGDENEGPEAPF